MSWENGADRANLIFRLGQNRPCFSRPPVVSKSALLGLVGAFVGTKGGVEIQRRVLRVG